MTTRIASLRKLAAALLLGVAPLAPSFAELGVPVLIDTPTNAGGALNAQLKWQTDPPRDYDVLATTNLQAGTWQTVNAQPIPSTNLIGDFAVHATNRIAFFQIRGIDREGPAIIDRYPSTNGVGVGRSAILTVQVTDETGVNTNSYRLAINGSTTVSNGSLGVTATVDSFQYDPGTNTWGTFGQSASVQFVCGDTIGNATTSSWSFTLEVEAVVTSALIHLPPPASGSSKIRASILSAAVRHNVKYSDNLSIVTFETNRIIFSYSGSHGLYLGGILISHDPARIFYRRITGLSDDTVNHLVTVDTFDVALTEIVQNGSFSPEVLVPPTGSAPSPLWTAQLSYGIPFSYVSEFTVLPIEIDDAVRITPGIVSVDLSGGAQVSCVISNWEVTTFDVTISSEFAAELRAQIEFYQSLDLISETETLVSVPLGYAVGFIGPVPVWVELQVAVDLGLTVGAEAAVSFETGIDAHADTAFRLFWNTAGWNSDFRNSFDVAPVPLDVGFQLSAEAWLYLKPRLSALLYSAAGVSADLRRGPSLEATWKVGDPQCEITLYDKWSMNVGMTVIGVDDGELPNQTLFQEKRTIQTWYYPEIAEQAPVFTLHPSNTTVSAGKTVTLLASATGNPTPTYQWYQNGIGIPFATTPQLSCRASMQSAGSYYVAAQNRLGRTLSATATVSVIGTYQVVTGVMSWQEARTDALNRGGHLVTINSADEWNHIWQLLGSTIQGKDYWIGATDEVSEGTWRWVTGEQWSYTRWMAGEPNNMGNEDYGHLYGSKSSDSRWNDTANVYTGISGYILER